MHVCMHPTRTPCAYASQVDQPEAAAATPATPAPPAAAAPPPATDAAMFDAVDEDLQAREFNSKFKF